MPDRDSRARSDLRRLGAAPKKKLGQNFLQNEPDLIAIASALNIQAGESVLEIGPGLGALTEQLIRQGAKVIAVEKDPAMIRHLKQKYLPSDLILMDQDILEVDIGSKWPARTPIKVAGNIPYNITSPILFWMIDRSSMISEAVLTVQWEVAERLCAKPGGKTWGALSVKVQSRAEVQLIRKIPRSHFYPVPKVDSAVIRLRFLDKPLFAPATDAAFAFWVAKAFQKRRKTLLNAIENDDIGWGKQRLASVLAGLGIDGRRRPETLTIGEWAQIASSLGNPHSS